MVAWGAMAGCQPRYKLVEQAPETAAPGPADRPRIAVPAEASPSLAAESSGNYRPLEWLTLRGLNPRTGAISEPLRKLEGGAVRIKGYMVPFADEYETAQEFLLVPQFGMCIHTPPPPSNQMVLVTMTGAPAKVDFSQAVEVAGILEIAADESPYGKVAFKIEAAEARAAP